MIDFVKRSNLIERQSHNTALLGDGLKNALTNPPYSVRDEFESTGFVKLLSGLYQSDVALINKVGKGKSLVLVLLSYRNDEAEVSGYEFVFGAFSFRTALLDFLCQLYLFVDGNQGSTSYLNKVLVQCFTRTICNALLNLKLSHFVYLKFSNGVKF